MPQPNAQILLIDDDDVDREYFKRLLLRSEGNFTCFEAASADAARALLREKPFDCVLLDYHLGRDRGLDLLPDIAAHRPQICPVILVTLREPEDVIVEAMRRGVSDYIAKPAVDGPKLRDIVYRAMQWAARQQAQIDTEARVRLATEALRQEHEEFLRLALLQATNVNQAKSQFYANMSHEIRTPLNAIIGLSYLLEQTELTGRQSDFVDKIKVAGKALLWTVNNVLDMSKIEDGRLRLDVAPFDPGEVVADVGKLAEVQIGGVQRGGRQVDFALVQADDMPRRVSGDAGRLHQILLNLVTNAIKFTESGHVRLDVRPIGDAVSGQLRIRFTVQDTGIGIAPGVLDRLFTPFVQADASTTRRYGGTGLGLSIAHDLTCLMGGEIGANSALGQGSAFWVELPFDVSEAADDMSHDIQDSSPAPALTGVRILLVDDSLINLEVGKSILELEGASVVTADNGARAVDLVVANPGRFDVVLMDLQMPVLDGYEAFRQIEWTLGPARPPILALTAGAEPGDGHDASLARMDGLVIKPFQLESLVIAIAEARLARGAAAPTLGVMTDPPPAPVMAPPPLPAETQPCATPSTPPAWPHIAGIDTDAVRERLAGNVDLFVNALRRLLEEYADLDADLDTGGAATDLVALQRRLHKLKGNAGLLGMVSVQAGAEAAERAAKAQDALEATELVKVVAREMVDMRQELAALPDAA